MNVYSRKSQWKIFLFIFAIAIILVSTWYTHQFLRKIAKDERAKVEIWAKAITRKAQLVNYTKVLFDELQAQEKKSVELWAEATRRFGEAKSEEDIIFYTEIISGNDNIPVIVTDEKGEISGGKNLDPFFANLEVLTPALRDSFTSYQPIAINYYANYYLYVYYQNSKIYVQLKHNLENLVQSFLNEVVENSLSTPVVILDSSKTKIIASGGSFDTASFIRNVKDEDRLSNMKNVSEPIIVDMPGYGKSYIYYKDSDLLLQLRYFPMVLLGVIIVFLIVSYFLFSISRKAEQNQVWAGLAKETAHQLGTPISSLMGWVEILKMDEKTADEAIEIEKDVKRLQEVSERFSKIGSKAELKNEDVSLLVKNVVDYMEKRSSSKVKYEFSSQNSAHYRKVNSLLLSWVIENIIKNALDAIEGKGYIGIHVLEQGKETIIDICDSGKGIPKSKFNTVFQPGYSTKNRGWGLGLSLAKRIITQYHKGKIFVKSSNPGEGSCFRIQLK